jgi:hypothetical protein
MNWSNKIRSRFGSYKLRKELKLVKTKHRFINFKDAVKIGILFDGSEESHLKEIAEYIKRLGEKKKQVKVLGYWGKKELAENPIKAQGYPYFTKKNINWIMIPSHPLVTDFINTPFDILININTETCFPLQYISGLSRATLRVGKYVSSGTAYYDLMINQKNADLKHYFEQVDHYLNLINQNQNE